MSNKTKTTRLGIFYRRNGEWTKTPYAGISITTYQSKRNPWKSEIKELKNYVLKSRIRLRPVKMATA